MAHSGRLPIRHQPVLGALTALALAHVVGCRDGEQHVPPPRASTAATSSTAPSSLSGPGGSAAGSSRGRPPPAARLLLADAWADRPPARTPLAESDLPRYRIDQQIDDDWSGYAGTLEIHFPNPTAEPLATLPLLLHPNAARELGVARGQTGSLTIDRIERGGRARSGPGPSVAFTRERPTLVLATLEPPVPPGDAVRLTVHYRGSFRRLGAGANDLFSQALGSMGTITAGAGASDYGLVAAGDGILTAASAYPMVAPFRDGAFDMGAPLRFGDLAYNQPARFEVRTTTSADDEVVTNLVDSPALSVDGGRRVVTSKGAFVRDFVLIAGRDLERASEQHGSTRVTSVYRRGDARAGRRALEMAVASLGCFERHFGPYPYAELDVVEASLVGGAGGVEFSAMVLVAGMLYRRPEDSSHPMALLMRLTGGLGPHSRGSWWDRWGFGTGGRPPDGGAEGPLAPATSASAVAGATAAGIEPGRLMSDLLARALDFTVAHEVAHQYFAGIVGNDSHRFPSLDEPIAQYAAGLVVEELHGKAAAEQAMEANVKLNYAVYRALGGRDRSVLRPVDQFETAAEYAGLVYGKAPYVYVALRRQLGAERLHRAIRQAVARHRFELVTTEEWIAALEESLGGTSSGLRPIFDRYLRQRHGDADLGVDESGDAVFDIMYGRAMGAQMRQTFAAFGLDPNHLLRMSVGEISAAEPSSPSAAIPPAAPRAGSGSSP